jgi:hypothetical protein
MYFSFLKAMPVNTSSKVARFEQPIIAVKNVIQPRKKASNDDDNVQGTKASTKKDNGPVADKKKDYVICHVSFCPRPMALSMLSGLAHLRKKRRSNMDF